MMLPMSALAQTSANTTYTDVQYLVVTDTAGVEYEFALTDAPVITYSAANIIVTSNADTLSTALGDVKDYKFTSKKVATGIQNLPAVATDEPQFSFANASISGLKAGTRVAVYGINGVLVSSLTAGQDGNVSVDLGNLPSGIYILRTPSKSFKIVNK